MKIIKINMDTIGKRLRFYVEEGLKSTANDFSGKTGIPLSSVYRTFNGESGLNSTTLAKIIECYPNLNITWLITGKGNYEETEMNNFVQEEPMHYGNIKDAELKMKVRTILNNEVVLDAFIEILKKYDR